MTDIISLIVFFVVISFIGIVIKAIFGGESHNDFRRDR